MKKLQDQIDAIKRENAALKSERDRLAERLVLANARVGDLEKNISDSLSTVDEVVGWLNDERVEKDETGFPSARHPTRGLLAWKARKNNDHAA